MVAGILVGVAVVLIASIVCEIRVMKERQEQGKALKAFSDKCDEHDNLKVKYDNLRKGMKELLDASEELTHDYVIIAGLLEREIGRDEAWNRYIEMKNEKTKDINELFKEIQARKGEQHE